LYDLYSEAFGERNDEGYSESSEFSKQWSWYSTIDELADSDLTKHQAIEEMNVHKCLLNLCYKISKRKKEYNELKKIQRNGK